MKTLSPSLTLVGQSTGWAVSAHGPDTTTAPASLAFLTSAGVPLNHGFLAASSCLFSSSPHPHAPDHIRQANIPKWVAIDTHDSLFGEGKFSNSSLKFAQKGDQSKLGRRLSLDPNLPRELLASRIVRPLAMIQNVHVRALITTRV